MRLLSIRCNELLRVLAALLFLCSAAFAGQVSFDGTLQTGVAALADQVRDDLRHRIGVQSVAVEMFAAPTQFAATAGAAIQKPLVEQLQKLGIDCRHQTGSTICRGDYEYHQEDIRITIRLRLFHDSQLISTHEQLVYSIPDICLLLGLSAELPTRDLAERTEQVARRIWGQQIHLARNPAHKRQTEVTLISASATSRFAMEVCVRGANGSFQPLPVIDDEGMAFVELPRDAVFALRVVNNSTYHAAVNVQIDGLGMFSFHEQPNYRAAGRMIVAPGRGGALMTGWYRDPFHIVPFSISGIASVDAMQQELGSGNPSSSTDDDQFGTITVSFAAAIPRGSELPQDETWPKQLQKWYYPERSDFFRQPLQLGLVREVISVRFVATGA